MHVWSVELLHCLRQDGILRAAEILLIDFRSRYWSKVTPTLHQAAVGRASFPH
jgi:hypothetical protein